MALKSENSIYTMIKALLAKADRPLTCVDLIDDHELKTEAHRQVERSSTDPKTLARFSYELAKTETVAPNPFLPRLLH